MVKVAKSIKRKFKKTAIFPLRKSRPRQKVVQAKECPTHFSGLPDEIVLMICRYLTPVHVIKAFLDYNERMFDCISDYRHRMNLTKCSYTDFRYFVKLFINEQLRPSTLILSNSKIATQIPLFMKYLSNTRIDSVHHLSLLQCTKDDFDDIDAWVRRFHSLESLTITESATTDEQIDYETIGLLRNLIFDHGCSSLTVINFSTVDGIILDKRLHPNKYLKQMTISLQKIDDLLVLLDGLVPNIQILNVTLCKSQITKRLSLPPSWPRRYMYHLIEFRLTTNDDVLFSFNHLQILVMSLIKLHKLTLHINQWTNNNQQSINTLIKQYMTDLRYFYCFIQTTNDINIQTFEMLNNHWPIGYGSSEDNSSKHVYTIPWSFEQLTLSMLAKDDTKSICPNVRQLTVDIPCKNLSRRFPNVHTLINLDNENLSENDYIQFRQLRYLETTNINMISSSAFHLHTLTLFHTDHLFNYSIIHSNIEHLIIEDTEMISLNLLQRIIRIFPNLHSLEMTLDSSDEYYDSLNLLLDNEHLPYLSFLRTNWIDDDQSNIQIWLGGNTPLKWKMIPVYGQCTDDYLTICL